MRKSSAGERRKCRRFRLSLSVVFSWRDEHGVLQCAEGCSSNISTRGIYIRTNTAPPPGSTVEMNVFLPQPAYDLRAAEIQATGQVTRVDQKPRTEFLGFAAMNRRVLIRDSFEQALDMEKKIDKRTGFMQPSPPAKQDLRLRKY